MGASKSHVDRRFAYDTIGLRQRFSVLMHRNVAWPEGKKFAFTVFDDTDLSDLERGPDIYAFLREIGLRTTKSVWTIDNVEESTFGGSTCQDAAYLEWVLELQDAGFEIASHGAASASSPRAETLRGLETFEEMFGHYPRIHVNHHRNRDGLYWGASRLTGANQLLYRLLTRNRSRGLDGGSTPTSKYFWGDVAKDRVTYVRNFVFSDINTLRQCPNMPYHDPARPLINYWFASSSGADCATFCDTISEDNQDRLEEEGGACIMYTHFGVSDFRSEGRLDPRFVKLMERMAEKNGWFVPVSNVLDHLREQRGHHVLTPSSRSRLERRWLYEKVFITRGSS